MKELRSLELPGIKKVRSGKVREVFDLGTDLLFVATDRISAFDCILRDPIPGKGSVLNRLSAFWFKRFHHVPSHFVTADFDQFPESLQAHEDLLRDRSMIVRKAEPLPIECVVRGYLAGSAWKDYQETGTVCGIKLPDGLKQASQLPMPIFSPATKAATGHDQNICWQECCKVLGEEMAIIVRDLSLALYRDGSLHAARRGIIVADTKFEFGVRDGSLLLIDECLTPDSSRFWPADCYEPGSNPVSYDKQFVRDYLETLGWDKTPPAPNLPAEVIAKTSQKYEEALSRLVNAG
jgi:phosphoribosylaminoimidazole-succinocarboxamide synthase